MKNNGDIETNYEVRSFDLNIPLEQYHKLPKNPLYIILDNLRSAFNVGSIFRLCDALRVTGLFLCGYTAYPPNRKLEKTSLGTTKFVPWRHFNDTVDAINYLKTEGIPVFAAETTSLSIPITEVIFPHPVGIVFGNEALGVSRDVLQKCDKIIEIPLYGFKNSINVAAACAVIGYRVLDNVAKSLKTF